MVEWTIAAMLMLGGIVNGKRSDSIIYNIRTRAWRDLPSHIPAALAGFSLVVANRYAFVIGGINGDDNAVNTMYRLSLVTWSGV